MTVEIWWELGRVTWSKNICRPIVFSFQTEATFSFLASDSATLDPKNNLQKLLKLTNWIESWSHLNLSILEFWLLKMRFDRCCSWVLSMGWTGRNTNILIFLKSFGRMAEWSALQTSKRGDSSSIPAKVKTIFWRNHCSESGIHWLSFWIKLF